MNPGKKSHARAHACLDVYTFVDANVTNTSLKGRMQASLNSVSTRSIFETSVPQQIQKETVGTFSNTALHHLQYGAAQSLGGRITSCNTRAPGKDNLWQKFERSPHDWREGGPPYLESNVSESGPSQRRSSADGVLDKYCVGSNTVVGNVGAQSNGIGFGHGLHTQGPLASSVCGQHATFCSDRTKDLHSELASVRSPNSAVPHSSYWKHVAGSTHAGYSNCTYQNPSQCEVLDTAVVVPSAMSQLKNLALNTLFTPVRAHTLTPATRTRDDVGWGCRGLGGLHT